MVTNSTNLSSYDPKLVPDGSSFKIHLVVSQWNNNITSDLKEGAINTLLKNNVKQANIKVWHVPGSFELVYGTKKAQSFDPDAVIAIGSIIQGQTKHFDFVCEAVTQGIKDLNVQSEVPAIFCVLTDHNLNQAQDRSGGKYGNKGVEAAVAALKMIQFRHTH